MAKRALITGISGQDGSYLAELLLEKGYEVYGIIRRHSVTENQQSRLKRVLSNVHNQYGDITDTGSLERIFRAVQPDEIYNLAAQSHVRVSFDIPQYTLMTNATGVLNVLDIIHRTVPHARMYQASSSEMFGNSVDSDGKQRETTPMHPVSPYGCAKLLGYSLVRNYRHAYGLFASNGILFNHESPRRGSNFATSKIVKNAILIKAGKINTLELGNLDSWRDWGHAKDYVRAMWAMLNHSEADDFVVATGETHTIRQFCEIVFSKLGMDYRDYVVQNPKFLRPEELNYLCGDSTKARTVLKWEPTFSFEALVEDMLENFEFFDE